MRVTARLAHLVDDRRQCWHRRPSSPPMRHVAYGRHSDFSSDVGRDTPRLSAPVPSRNRTVPTRRLVDGPGQVQSVVADAAGQAVRRRISDPQAQRDRVAVVFDQLAAFRVRPHA